MKTFLTILLSLFMYTASATQVLWAGIDANALVHLGNQTMSIANWITSLEYSAGGRIRIGDTALYAGFEDPSGYIPPGQTAPSIVWEADFEGDHYGPYTDFELEVVDQNGNPMPGQYADWQPIKLLSDSSSHVKIYFDIGYFDENADWDFVAVATAADYLDNIWDAHTYTAGTLLPPTETPWKPQHYYGIPEPSASLLALLGIGMFLKRRK